MTTNTVLANCNMKLETFTLFLNAEDIPMHFIVQMRNTDDGQNVCNIIAERLGSATTRLDEFGPYSVVLVDKDAVRWKHQGDVFDVSYIDACIEAGRILNISKFLKSKSKLFVENFEYMKIVYFHEYEWSSVNEEYLLKNDADLHIKKEEDVLDSEEVDPKPNPKLPATCKKTRLPYSRKEKEAILRFLLDNDFCSRIKGREVWCKMEASNICPLRTWQSTKEHFLKTISKELNSFRNITKEERVRLSSQLK